MKNCVYVNQVQIGDGDCEVMRSPASEEASEETRLCSKR